MFPAHMVLDIAFEKLLVAFLGKVLSIGFKFSSGFTA